ncbi:tRNA A64-2'-O-ribosylphosphate transferase isoform X1 [Solanum pennellii]|uniref:tRNA A64-2'-O-ribosylphosphate transferase isoform X1 n=1 Tax=Solanum pennellii TaxID=28526 RepID=A0ABM1FPN9_SOLPN|nr:tRNA A64-2'-O-ribosylphosphate transferase isoform X1 [Solanum pennellii]
MENRENLNIYKASRTIKRSENTLYNALRSIYEDSIFVGEIAQLWPELPLLANLRCGLWYSMKFHSTCYFKSTDGHTNNWSFNTSRLNLHVALLAGQKGGCMIVDSTRKGKRFPDSMSKTIPIWTCVLNRAIMNYRTRFGLYGGAEKNESNDSAECGNTINEDSYNWDCSLHLPLWVSNTERVLIEERLDGWTKDLEVSGADIASIALSLKKPLRPLWISQKTVIWLNEVPDCDSWDFTPIILVSTSSPSSNLQQRTTSEFSWRYIAGAGDDEESWARGLSPSLFWKHAYDLINSGPDTCNKTVADIVEKDRVYRAQRGENAPQISIKPSKSSSNSGHLPAQEQLGLEPLRMNIDEKIYDKNSISWLGETNLAVGTTQLAKDASGVDCVLSCDLETNSFSFKESGAHLNLSIVSSKFDRSSLLRNLPSAVNFAKNNLRKGKKLLVCCNSGEDISICVCLAILMSLFDDKGNFDEGRLLNETRINKLELRRRLVFICQFAVNARPSRGNVKQVFSYLCGGNVAITS